MRFTSLLFMLLALSHSVWAEDFVVDGSTREAYERSIKTMAESLPEEDRELFAKGLIDLVFTRYPPAQGAKGLEALLFIQPAAEAAHITLDGVGREEIVERGRELAARAKARTSEKETSVADVKATLRQCIQERVIFTNAVVEQGSFGHTIQIEVTNGLSWAIAGIRIGYTITSAGRSVPWEQDDFALSISGGIEPGETRTVRTSIQRIHSDAPSDLMVDVEVLDVADPQFRQLLRDVRVIGGKWTDETSDLPCE